MIRSPLFWAGVFMLPAMLLLVGVFISTAIVQSYGPQSYVQAVYSEYHDPSNYARRARYWDGQRWSDWQDETAGTSYRSSTEIGPALVEV